ncbi:hypothetical protein [Amycolatopsis sp. NPDC004079]
MSDDNSPAQNTGTDPEPSAEPWPPPVEKLRDAVAPKQPESRR